VHVDNAVALRQDLGELSEMSSEPDKSPAFNKDFGNGYGNCEPSRVLVPRPSSSMITMLCLVMLRRIKVVSRISAAKVEMFALKLSSIEIRAKSC